MVRNRYNQIPHPALKTKREITKYFSFRGERRIMGLYPPLESAYGSYLQHIAEVKFRLSMQEIQPRG